MSSLLSQNKIIIISGSCFVARECDSAAGKQNRKYYQREEPSFIKTRRNENRIFNNIRYNKLIFKTGPRKLEWELAKTYLCCIHLFFDKNYILVQEYITINKTGIFKIYLRT